MDARQGRRVVLASVLVCVLLGGCSDDDPPPAEFKDSFVAPDGGALFLATCSKDTDCASGHCVVLGGTSRCSRPCSSSAPCPAFPEWTCNSESFCQCSGTGKQPSLCNVDGDCDGKADKPTTQEICNDEDDDCNGTVDDVAPYATGATQYYRDADGDGFGDDAQSKWLCQAETGWITKPGDCDDSRKEDNPGAPELCGDAYDNDCDGTHEDSDVCGLTPITVPDVNGSYSSATLKTCSTTTGLQKSLDITEILGKQDKTSIKLTVRLAGSPATATCTSYVLGLGDPKNTDLALVYVYRPAVTPCGTIPAVQAFLNGQPLTSTVQTAFNAADPGHISFVLDKAEIFPHLPQTTYRVRACVNATADPVQDKTSCVDDSCETLVHR
ncbi:MAG: putative metal-binding motif-containing protein [Deltaproteobacteria bacterium]|jgi:hypothetical protein|nr:putative metal-binding motif-containing protein [Deltaproteobacteria bacterium]